MPAVTENVAIESAKGYISSNPNYIRMFNISHNISQMETDISQMETEIQNAEQRKARMETEIKRAEKQKAQLEQKKAQLEQRKAQMKTEILSEDLQKAHDRLISNFNQENGGLLYKIDSNRIREAYIHIQKYEYEQALNSLQANAGGSLVTVEGLRKAAAKANIPNRSTMNKAQLIRALGKGKK
jgi:chromosome segregation ATPase